MNTRWLSLALVAASLSPLAAQAQQAIVPAQSEVGFTSRQMGVPVDGKFKTFSAQVAFDPAKLATSKIAFTVDTGSATLGSRETDAELPKPTWFNVPKFPQAQFESTAIKALGGGKFEVAGALTIKGNSQNVVVCVQQPNIVVGESGQCNEFHGESDYRKQAFKCRLVVQFGAVGGRAFVGLGTGPSRCTFGRCLWLPRRSAGMA